MEIQTSCRDCVFARYLDRVQIGCALGRIDKYADQGVTEEVRDEEENGLEFYLVKRACTTFLDKDDPRVKQVPSDELSAFVRKAVGLRLDVFVYFNRDKQEEELYKTVDSLVAQKLAPFSVHVINDDGAPVVNLVVAFRDRYPNLNWLITDIVQHGYYTGREFCVDRAISKTKGSYYSVWNAGAVVPDNFVSSIDAALNDDLDRFSLLTAFADGNGMVCQRAMHVHAAIGGNNYMEIFPAEEVDASKRVILRNVAEKVIYYAETTRQPHLVKRVEDVCK